MRGNSAVLLIMPALVAVWSPPECRAADVPDLNYYLGIKAGVYRHTGSEYSQLTTVGPLLGINYPSLAKGVFSMELEVLPALSTETVKPDGTWSARASMLTVAYRSLGSLYFKANLGVLHGKTHTQTSTSTSSSKYDIRETFAAGVGFRLNRHNFIELEGIEFDSEIDIATLGYHYMF